MVSGTPVGSSPLGNTCTIHELTSNPDTHNAAKVHIRRGMDDSLGTLIPRRSGVTQQAWTLVHRRGQSPSSAKIVVKHDGE